MDRCEFLKLSMEERRQILADQAEGMVDYYENPQPSKGSILDLPENPYLHISEQSKFHAFNEGQQSLIDAGWRPVPSKNELESWLKEGE